MPVNVSIVPCPDYSSENVRRALSAALEPLGGLDWVEPGMTVAVKTNLVSRMKPESAAVTPGTTSTRTPGKPGASSSSRLAMP